LRPVQAVGQREISPAPASETVQDDRFPRCGFRRLCCKPESKRLHPLVEDRLRDLQNLRWRATERAQDGAGNIALRPVATRTSPPPSSAARHRVARDQNRNRRRILPRGPAPGAYRSCVLERIRLRDHPPSASEAVRCRFDRLEGPAGERVEGLTLPSSTDHKGACGEDRRHSSRLGFFAGEARRV